MKRFFRKGDNSNTVRILQQRLKDLGFYTMRVDGDFGPETEKSVIEFQLKADLNADGVVGPVTWEAIGLDNPLVGTPAMPPPIPNGLDEINNVFGDPLEPGYWKEYGGFCETPPELNHCFTYTFEGKNGFWCNKQLIPQFQKVYSSIVKSGLAKELQTFDGCFIIRYVRGVKKLSTHSWAISVDHNASTNRLGATPKIHAGIIQCFENNGFQWGGRFKRRDGMHFQYAKGY